MQVVRELRARQRFDDALIEPHVSDAARYSSILDEKRAVTCHSGNDRLFLIDGADIPKPCDKQSTRRLGDEVFSCLRAGLNHDV